MLWFQSIQITDTGMAPRPAGRGYRPSTGWLSISIPPPGTPMLGQRGGRRASSAGWWPARGTGANGPVGLYRRGASLDEEASIPRGATVLSPVTLNRRSSSRCPTTGSTPCQRGKPGGPLSPGGSRCYPHRALAAAGCVRPQKVWPGRSGYRASSGPGGGGGREVPRRGRGPLAPRPRLMFGVRAGRGPPGRQTPPPPRGRWDF